MSFREQSAWITLVSVIICFGAYATMFLTGQVSWGGWPGLHFALLSTTALVILQIVLNLIATLLNLKAARTPRDEREQLIQARSHTFGYYVMMASVVVQIIPIHFRGAHVADIVNIAVLGLAAAVAAVAVAQIVMFRRGA